MPAPPVFIVCNARSGSTLLRCLLDSHPEIACPGETRMAQLTACLLEVSTQLAATPSGPAAPRPAAAASLAASDIVSGLIAPYLAQRGKSVWCDKSLFTAEYLDQFVEVFPDARYVCLHRHAMDVIASGLEACRWGFRHYGFDSYVQRSTDNFVDALASYWLERTAAIVSFEESGRAPTYRVHYEHLVSDPEGTLAGLLDFLRVERSSQVVRQMLAEVFVADHGPGWGDHKMGLTASIGSASVGRGRAIPAILIRPHRRSDMNAVLRALGYAEVTEDWNVSGRADPSPAASANRAPRVDHLVRGLLLPRLQAAPALAAPGPDLVLTYGPGLRQRWRVDAELKTITRLDERAAERGVQITMRAEVLTDLLLRGLTVDSALRARMILVTGGQGAEQQAMMRLLAVLMTE
jgi:protein-tyrosine sulfotransferase